MFVIVVGPRMHCTLATASATLCYWTHSDGSISFSQDSRMLIFHFEHNKVWNNSMIKWTHFDHSSHWHTRQLTWSRYVLIIYRLIMPGPMHIRRCFPQSIWIVAKSTLLCGIRGGRGGGHGSCIRAYERLCVRVCPFALEIALID